MITVLEEIGAAVFQISYASFDEAATYKGYVKVGKAKPPVNPVHEWQKVLPAQQQAQIKHAQEYCQNHSDAHIAGHNQFILISNLAHLLDEAEEKLKKIEGLVKPASAATK